ncbi:MAG TPA: TonB-dependent receptor [Longimicrobium sp.]|jgi:iron complex outermembrane receptor protein
MNGSTRRHPWRALLAAACMAAMPALAAAQSGTVRGTVAGPDGDAIRAAQVTVVGTRYGSTTNALGQFTLTGVPAGPRQLRVSRAGFLAKTHDVTVAAGEEALVAVRLESSPVELDGLVVSASRRAERRSEAPVTVTRVGPEVLDNLAGGSFVGALKQANGLDFVQVGVTSVGINARGFNSSFNNRMLMLEDGRIAVLPENGLPVGAFTPIPKIDLAGIEVVVGPGSALYGADASNGVLTLQSKDPREYPGTQVEVAGGSRQYTDVQMRHAAVRGSFGYKLAGEYNQFNDWSNRIRATAAATSPMETSVGDSTGLNWDSDVARAYGAAVYYRGDAQFELNGGWSRTNGVGQTNVGRNQLVDWTYQTQQFKATFPRFYFTAYHTESDAGKSYAANRYTTFRAAPALASQTDEQIRQMSDWPSNGQIFAAEFQNNFRVRPLLNTSVVWGAQVRHDVVSSERQWLTDRLTGDDLTIDQRGVYAQTETPLLPQLKLLLAGRYDDHENYDAQFSPKAGLVFTPVEGHSVRAFYNRAFKSPSTLQTNFYIPNFAPTFGVFGNPSGFTVRNAAGDSIHGYRPMEPEENRTWEVGYKALINGRLFVDVAAYYSRYKNFMSPLTLIANPFAAGGAATTAFGADGKPLVDEQGNPQRVLTYFNLGEATIRGTDVSANYVLSRNVDFTGTVSLVELDGISGIDTKVPGEVEATALNSPGTKWTLGTRLRDLGNWQGGLTARYVNGYQFNSGINKGRIPTFSTLDLNVGYRVPRFRSAINLGVNNLFGCASDNPGTADTDESGCGFDQRHIEMINMPEIGTMVFLGLRFDTK